MIKVTFDLYNENTYVNTHEKEFKDEEESNEWFRSQVGHPYLSFNVTNIVEIDKAAQERAKFDADDEYMFEQLEQEK